MKKAILDVCRVERSGKNVEEAVAKLALIYGMRLLPEEDLGQVGDATVTLKNGKTARVAMHLIEGSKEEIEKTFHQSIEAFFDMYPEI
ncbi:MAG: allantoinase [Candidatus Acidiferrum sp.]